MFRMILITATYRKRTFSNLGIPYYLINEEKLYHSKFMGQYRFREDTSLDRED